MKLHRAILAIVFVVLTGLGRAEVAALLTEAEYGDFNTVKALLDGGAEIDVTNQNGQTPLMIAANMGKLDMVQLLIDRGANINAIDRNRWSVLIHSAITAQADVVRLLIAKGADVKAAARFEHTALIAAAQGTGGTDPRLLVAALEGRALVRPKPGNLVEALRLLLDAGLDPNARDGHMKLPPIELDAVSYDPEAVRLLLERGAKIDPAIESRDRPNAGLLVNMATRRSPEIVLMLIKAGSDVNGHGPDRWSALMMASAYNDADTVRVLIENGADVNYRIKAGRTALSVAPGSCESPVVRLLKKAGATGRCD